MGESPKEARKAYYYAGSQLVQASPQMGVVACRVANPEAFQVPYQEAFLEEHPVACLAAFQGRPRRDRSLVGNRLEEEESQLEEAAFHVQLELAGSLGEVVAVLLRVSCHSEVG